MFLLLISLVFLLGYIAIALEHPIHINKAATALLTGVLCWTLYAVNCDSLISDDAVPAWFSQRTGHHVASPHELKIDFLLEGQLVPALGEISGVLFFLLGAMTIVEIVDAFEGFGIITDRIQARSKLQLLWIVSLVTFFLSAVLDNLTTTIVMISLVRKLVADRETKLFFAGMIVCAANAGGAWTVIGDVTTTMLWIKEKISPIHVMIALFVPSLVCLVVPLLVLSFRMKGEIVRPERDTDSPAKNLSRAQQLLMLGLGLFGLLLVPAFKAVTHLPPYMGILLSLSIVWIVAEIVRHDLDEETKSSTHVLEVLKRVDSSSILFFLGILLAINCLAQIGVLGAVARQADSLFSGNTHVIAIIIGLVSSVVDNVPLVAAGIEMYPQFPRDHSFWEFLAYCAGTGGSCLIIGSAAGVAAMGLERIDFIWYLRKITPWALLGYLAGAGCYVLLEPFLKMSSGS